MIDEMTETKSHSGKCPSCGAEVIETRNAVVSSEKCTKCNWSRRTIFL